jgi:hypothetical protein
MEMEKLAGRSFQVWDYSPSLQRLLIRSPRRNEREPNIDIIFMGVDYFDLRTLLGEISSIQTEEVREKNHQKYLLETAEGLHTVEAFACSIETSDTDIFESPLEKL